MAGYASVIHKLVPAPADAARWATRHGPGCCGPGDLPGTVSAPPPPVEEPSGPCRAFWRHPECIGARNGACRRGRPEQCRAKKRGTGVPACSPMSLFINSSSSRAGAFLWTSRFCPMLTMVCVPSKGVGGGLFLPPTEMNNLALPPRAVDNMPFIPDRHTGLSTG